MLIDKFDKTILIIIAFGCYYNILSSQNLVLNPSFEDMVKCPDDLQQFDKNTTSWSTPTSGSTDLFTLCTDFQDIKSTVNYQGSQPPKNGSNYAGCYFYGINDYREYIQGSLSDSLIIGSKYKVSLWVSLADKSDMAISDIQILFSDKIFKSYNSQNISLNKSKQQSAINQLIAFTDQIIHNKEDWVLLENEFVANERTLFFIIGNFNSNRETNKKNQKFFTMVRKAYYYIDDISVVKIDPVLESVVITNQEFNERSFDTDQRYTFQNLQFEFDRWNIQKTSFEELSELVKHLLKNPELTILIEGHTDEKGSEDYNLDLAYKRVMSVRDFLVLRGISEERIEIISHGESLPKITGTTNHVDQQNRRVEFTLRTK